MAEAAAAASADTSGDAEAATAKIAEAYDAMAGSVAAAYAKVDESASVAAKTATTETEASSAAVSGSLSKVGEVGAAAFGAVVIGSLDMADKFDVASNKIAASAGISQEAASKLSGALLNAANGTIFSGTQMVTAYGQVAGQLKEVEGHSLSAAQGVTVMTAANNLAAASGTSLGSATSDVVSILQAYGLKVSDAANVSNTLYTAAIATGNSVDTETAALTKLRTKLGDLAPPLSQTAALQLDLANTGETGRAGTAALTTAYTTLLKPAAAAAAAQNSLKAAADALPPSLQAEAKAYMDGSVNANDLTNFSKTLTGSQAALFGAFTKAATASDTASQAQAKLGITVMGAHGQILPMVDIIAQLHTKLEGMGKAQQVAELTAMGFGSASSKLLGIIDAGPGAYEKAAAAINKQNAAHLAAEKATDNLKDKLKVLANEFENEGVKIGNVLMPKIEMLVGAFSHIVDWVMRTKAVLIPLGVVIGGVMVAATAAFAVNMGVKLVHSIQSAYQSMTTLGSKLLDLIPSFSSTGEAATASAEEVETSQVAAAASISATSEAATASASEMAASQSEVQLAFSETGVAAEQMSLELGTSFDTAGAAATEFGTTAEIAGETAGAGMDAALGPIGLVIIAGTLIATHWKMVSHLLIDAWHGIEDAAKFVFHHIVEILKIAGEAALVALMPMIGIPLLLATHWKQVTHIASEVFGAVVGFFKRWGLDVLEAVFPVAGIAIFLAKHWHKVESDAKAIWGDILSFFKSIPGKILAVFESAGSWLVHIGSEILHGLWNGILAVASLVMDVGSKVEHWILDGLKDAGKWLLDIGKDIIKGLIHGIEDMASAPGKAVEAAAHGVISVAKSILGVFSPSTVFAEIGKNVMQGLAQGISQNKALAEAELKALDIGKELVADFQKVGAAAIAMGATFRSAASAMTTLRTAASGDASGLTVLKTAMSSAAITAKSIVADLRLAGSAMSFFGGQLRATGPESQSFGQHLSTAEQIFHRFGTAVTQTDSIISRWRASLNQADSGLTGMDARLAATTAMIRAVGTAAQDVFAGIITDGIDMAKTALDDFGDDWNTQWTNALTLLQNFWSTALPIFQQVKIQGLDYIRIGTDLLTSEWISDWSLIRSTLTSSWSQLQPIFSQMRTTGLDQLRTDADTLKTDWGTDWGTIQKAPGSAWSAMSGTFSSMTTALTNADSAVSKLSSDWSSDLSGMASDVTSAFPSPSTMLYGVGQDLATGLANGINSEAASIGTAAAAVVQQAVTAARNQAKAKSPSQVMHQLGQDMATGLANGLDATTGVAQSAGARVAAAVASAITGPMTPAKWASLHTAVVEGGGQYLQSLHDTATRATAAIGAIYSQAPPATTGPMTPGDWAALRTAVAEGGGPYLTALHDTATRAATAIGAIYSQPHPATSGPMTSADWAALHQAVVEGGGPYLTALHESAVASAVGRAVTSANTHHTESATVPSQQSLSTVLGSAPIPSTLILNLDGKQVANLLIPDLRPLLYQKKRQVVTLEMS